MIKPTNSDIDATSQYLKFIAEAYALTQKQPFSVEDTKRADTLLKLAEIEQLRVAPGAIRRTELAALEKQAGTDPETQTRTFQRWERFDLNGLEPREQDFMNRRRKRFDANEERALGVGTGSGGGFLAPKDEMQAFVEVTKDFSAMRRTASVMSTRRGTDSPVPSADETLSEGEMVVESGTITELDTVFSQVILKAYKFTSKIERVSREYLEDAQDAPIVVRRLLAARIGRIQNKKFTTGNGTTEPQGVVTGATLGKTGIAGQTTSIIYDDFVDLVHSVDPAYRVNGIFQMNDTTLKVARKIKDSGGMPLVTNPAGIRDSILGYPVVVNNDVAVMSANAKSVLFGDFSKYQIRDVQELVLLRLVELFATTGQVGFVALLRSDGRLLVPSAVRYYQNAAS